MPVRTPGTPGITPRTHRTPAAPSHRQAPQRHTLLEFFALTFLVVAVAFTAGVVVRKSHLKAGGESQTVGLMRVDRAADQALRTFAEPAPPTPAHRLVSAVGPKVIAEPVAVAPVVEPSPAAPDVDLATLRPSGKAVPMFNGRPLKKSKTIRMLVTAYSPDERSCGDSADGITASGYSVWTNGMKMVAADKKMLPFGAVLSIPGYNGGQPVPVLDRGGAIKGHRLDVLYPTHEIAMKWGKQWLDVTVWEYAD